jgi:cyclopropane fatty-acyl-phospholipid synthase-like methyltransferase
MKPRSEACERNRDPILKVLMQWFLEPGTALEIGSGTGQHAVYFARHLPHITWLCSDLEDNRPGIRAWVTEAQLSNLPPPLRLDVSDSAWPVERTQYVFSANTAHIMSWAQVQAMFAGVAKTLGPNGVFCLYGPFNHKGEFTSDSNRAFDSLLRSQNPEMGVRNDLALITLSRRCDMQLTGDYWLPANNRALVWVKQEAGAEPTARSRALRPSSVS